jgi:hypothetical protein
MNKTNQLAAFVFEAPSDSTEAQENIPQTYPGAFYRKETDSFGYRGIMFDYFKSGIHPTNGNSYTLVDKKFDRCWVFTYGNPDEMFEKYIESVNSQKRINKCEVEYRKWENPLSSLPLLFMLLIGAFLTLVSLFIR